VTSRPKRLKQKRVIGKSGKNKNRKGEKDKSKNMKKTK